MEKMTENEYIQLLELLNKYQRINIKPNIKNSTEINSKSELAISIMADSHNKVIEEIKECIYMSF